LRDNVAQYAGRTMDIAEGERALFAPSRFRFRRKVAWGPKPYDLTGITSFQCNVAALDD
jgi:hypothetical protein